MANMNTHVDPLDEKPGALEVETVPSSNHTDIDALDPDYVKKEKRVTRKVDYRLVPILGAVYAISGIDRTNISNARVAGMAKDLQFTIGSRYSIALLVFFITYFLFEIPSNIVLRKVGAARWLSFLAFSWGICILGAGFAKRWTDIVAIRLLIGLFEAGFFPGCMYLISCWYKRYEVQKRIAFFYSINVFANGFGNILAYGFLKMEGLGGQRGWRWIFIMEGIITVLLAVMGYLLIVDFPDKVHLSSRPFLQPDEVQLIKDKLEKDRGDSTFDEITFRKFIKTLGKWQLWIYALFFMSTAVCIYAFAFFTQIILLGMGYTVSEVFLLCAPPAVASIPYSLAISYFADKTRLRSPFIIFQALTCLVGLMIISYTKQNGVRYFGIFLGIAGCNGNLPTILAWQANNIRGQSTRAIASGLQVAFGAVGGIYASLTFMEKELPTYRSGIWAAAATQIFIIVFASIMAVYYMFQNKKANAGRLVIEELESFRYTL